FLEKVTEQLCITGVRFEHMRAEDAGHSKVLRGKFDVAVSRAVARLSVLAEYCLPLVKKGGSMIALKGSKYKEEMDEAGKAVGILGGKIIEAREVVLPGLDDGRAIIVIQKIKDTPSLYPRKAGLPAKKPLGGSSGI
ncbi:MAG: class I SAM-dependent methyltransferase, partial [Acidaminococcaceae bacterium]|nr:class I SAM-dependent methyltransferase [Acidaminococcaceae bacterium]